MESESLSNEAIEAEYFPGAIPPSGPHSLLFSLADGKFDGKGSFFFEAAGGIEVLLPENNGLPSDIAVDLLRQVAEHFQEIREAALRLARSFARDEGSWSLDSIDFGTRAAADRCDFQCHLSLAPNDGSDSYGYTDFVVCFRKRKNADIAPFAAFKLIIELL